MRAFDAVIAALRAVPELKDIVYDSAAPIEGNALKRSPYVVVYSSTPVEVDARLSRPVGRVEHAFTVSSVGVTPELCRRVYDVVLATLRGVRLTIPGMVCWPIRLDGSDELTPADQGALFYWDQDFTFITE